MGRILSAGIGLHIISERVVLHLYVCSFFDSGDMPVRALAIEGKEKLIGSRDGLFILTKKIIVIKVSRFHSYAQI